jgi:hypothetical protein
MTTMDPWNWKLLHAVPAQPDHALTTQESQDILAVWESLLLLKRERIFIIRRVDGTIIAAPVGVSTYEKTAAAF